MLGRKGRGQMEMVFAGSIAEFIPDDHILMRVDKVLDLSWLSAEVADCYSPHHGRPGIDPEVAVRLMLAGLLCGIVHDRRLMREAQVNLAIRWFAGFGLTEVLPDHSSLTRIRQRWGGERFKRIFEKSVEACVAAKLVGGDMLHVDATLIRADVSWASLAVEHVGAVNKANDDDDNPPTSPHSSSGPGRPRNTSTKPRKVRRSRTDRDARMATNKYNQRLEPCFKQHTGVDAKCGVQVDVSVERADVHEGAMLLKQVARVEQLTGKKLNTVTADKAYASADNFASLEERNIDAIIPPAKTRPAKVPLSRFAFDQLNNVLRCPRGRHLKPGARTGRGRFYRTRTRDCKGCKLAADCLPKSSPRRSIIVQDGHGALLRARRRHAKKLPGDRAAYHSHRFRVEGVHGEAKTRHGLNRAIRRGLENIAIQTWLTAAAINLKRLAKAAFALFWAMWSQIINQNTILINELTRYNQFLKNLPQISQSTKTAQNQPFFNTPLATNYRQNYCKLFNLGCPILFRPFCVWASAMPKTPVAGSREGQGEGAVVFCLYQNSHICRKPDVGIKKPGENAGF